MFRAERGRRRGAEVLHPHEGRRETAAGKRLEDRPSVGELDPGRGRRQPVPPVLGKEVEPISRQRRQRIDLVRGREQDLVREPRRRVDVQLTGHVNLAVEHDRDPPPCVGSFEPDQPARSEADHGVVGVAREERLGEPIQVRKVADEHEVVHCGTEAFDPCRGVVVRSEGIALLNRSSSSPPHASAV